MLITDVNLELNSLYFTTFFFIYGIYRTKKAIYAQFVCKITNNY
jgi:hypothetical protein